MLSATMLVKSGLELGRNEKRKVNMLGNQLEQSCSVSIGEIGKVDESIKEACLMRNRHRYFLQILYGFAPQNYTKSGEKIQLAKG